MKENNTVEKIEAYKRNPHVLRKLVRFTGYIPANIIDKENKLIASIKIPQYHENDILRAGKHREAINVELDGQEYHTHIAKVIEENTSEKIQEVELMVAS